jgi:hypothetical protein
VVSRADSVGALIFGWCWICWLPQHGGGLLVDAGASNPI